MTDTTTSPAATRAVTPTGVNHLVLNVSDLEDSHRFWTEIVGFHQVGELKGRNGNPPAMKMRFYSGLRDGVQNHHDLALVEQPGLTPPPEEWSMVRSNLAVNHIAITYPDREAWLAQVAHVQAAGVKVNVRVNHGMTHSIYVNDPNGYGVELLYELPREVWGHDIDGALNYAERLKPEDALVDDTDYTRNFS